MLTLRHPAEPPLFGNPHRPRGGRRWDHLDPRPAPPTFTPARVSATQCDRLAGLLWGRDAAVRVQGVDLLIALLGEPPPPWWVDLAAPLPIAEGRWKRGTWRRAARLLLALWKRSPTVDPLLRPLLVGRVADAAAREAYARLEAAGSPGVSYLEYTPGSPLGWQPVRMLRPREAEALIPYLPAHLLPVLARVTAWQGLPPWTGGEVLAVLLGALEESVAATTEGAP